MEVENVAFSTSTNTIVTNSQTVLSLQLHVSLLFKYFINKFNNVYCLKAYHVLLNSSTILREIAVIRK